MALAASSRHFPKSIPLAVAPFALMCAFLPLDLLGTIYTRSQTTGGDYRVSAATAIAVTSVAICYALLHRSLRQTNPETRFVVTFLFLTAAPPLTWFVLGVVLLPQPHRYHHEMELALALAASLAVAQLLRRLPRAALPITIATALACLILTPINIAFAHRQLQPRATKTNPAGEALQWVRSNLPPEARLMIGGELGFAANLEIPNPQIGSGHEPSSPNTAVPIGLYTIYTGQNAGSRDAEISTIWLKALGAQAILVPRKKPCEACLQPFRNPEKFEGRLPKLFENEGWRIYSTGLPGDSLFRVLPQSAMIHHRPQNGLETTELDPFTSALIPNHLDITHHTPAHLSVTGNFTNGQALSFATTYNVHWTATIDGAPTPVFRDGLDFMYILPPPGRHEIEWSYNGATLGLRLLTALLRSGI